MKTTTWTVMVAVMWGGVTGVVADEAIETREVSYPAGEVTAEGYLAVPAGGGKHPGVLVVHEWWGHNSYARERAEKLAGLGYAALAVDMYGGGKQAEHPKDAGAYAGAVRSDWDEARARFAGAMAFLRSQEATAAGDVAAIGYCFGGNVVLQMARFGLDGLAGVASFHGALNLEHPDGVEVDAKVLVCHGAADSFIADEVVATFRNEMEAAGADMEFISYEGAKHSFTNPEADRMGEKFGLEIAYDAEADRKSWAALKAFLAEVFPERKG